ncbi:hypothetical protein CGCA056_v000613 [Colletotrichum aenigma]|uniref:uncharacterized protein n=1 Tax=Colletotrichum aenigma TaxID=1215731 RepID=UPI0018728CA5|nr:uncharacterized protein CGCA056_v000613 [Colletotrichum aenigma]KAF5527472.1 hypothetical protein CGCA056_v000613 [Colletotrichum aenigma]
MASLALTDQVHGQDISSARSFPSRPPSYNGEDSRESFMHALRAEQEAALAADAESTQSNRPSTTKKTAWEKSREMIPSGEYHWALEIGAIIISISSLVAILVLLPISENRPLASWPLPVSLNAIISVLGATSRASLAFAISACISQGKWNWFRQRNDNIMVFDRFEEASRGPWGSLRLLWWTKLRHWKAVGAHSAVVLVGFEPFLQAVITFSGEEVEFVGSENSTSIGKTVTLDSGTFTEISESPVFVEPLPEPWGQFGGAPFRWGYDFGALAAVWEGFSDINTAENLKPEFRCSTGNCTWPSYASIATCSSCRDVSSHITTSSGIADVTDGTLITVYHDNHSNMQIVNLTFDCTRHELKSQNLSISNFNGLATKEHTNAQSPTGKNSAYLTARAINNPGRTIAFQDSKTLITAISMLKASQNYRNREQNWEDSTVTAEECALYFCTNVYRSAIEQGRLNETILGSYTFRDMDSYAIVNQPDEKSKVYDKYVNYTLLSPFPRSDLYLVLPEEEFSSETGISVPNDLRFRITFNTTSLLRWISGAFSRTDLEWSKQLNFPVIQSGETEQPFVINRLGASTNLTKTFETVAASLTKWMRNRSLQTESFVGARKEWVVRIRVSWSFLILPIGSLLGGCIFCLMSIFETRGLGLPAWRGSSLATLAHGLGVEARALLREARDGEQIAT